MPGRPTPWDVADWRRRVHALYREVRSESAPAVAHAHWVAVREELLRTHPASPVVRTTALTSVPDGTPPVAAHAPYDPAYRFVVPVRTDLAPERREISTGTDGVVGLERCGRVDLPGLGSLDVWWVAGYGGGIFVPVRDATSGAATGVSTYGAGRYVLDTVKGADLGGDPAALVVDLNFAYQPSCAYDPAWACPLPSAGNTLAAPVPVGELYLGSSIA